jgi:hypothetical protein
MNKKEALERLQSIEKETKYLREIIEKEDPPLVWHPKGGDWVLWSDGEVVMDDENDFLKREFGVLFTTKKSAERAKDFYQNYHRLYKLAEELNPSGKAGGPHEIMKCKKWEISSSVSDDLVYLGSLFETIEVAQRACEILNRNLESGIK